MRNCIFNVASMAIIFALFGIAMPGLALSSKACQLVYGRFSSAPATPIMLKQINDRWSKSTLVKSIESAVGCKLVIKLYTNQSIIKAVANKEVDIAYLKDYSYFHAKKALPNVQPIVIALSPNIKTKKPSFYYSSFLISLVSNKTIHSISDLKNKRLGLLSHTSTSGYVLPFAALKEKGINPATFFKSITYYNNQDDVLFKALLDKKVDAIATWDDVILRNKPVEFKVLMQINDIPNPPMIAVTQLGHKKRQALMKVLVALPCSTRVDFPRQCWGKPPANFYNDLFARFDKISA